MAIRPPRPEVFGFISLVLALLTFSAPASAQELPKLDIGVVLPLSGPQAAYGQEMLRGMELAIERAVTTEPKLAGKVQLVTGDEKSLTAEATAAATQLIEKQRAHILIGSITSPSTTAVAAVARKLQRPLISPLTTTRAVSAGGYVFRLSLDDGNQGSLLARFASDTLKTTTAAILRDDTDSALAVASGFTQVFQTAGGKVTTTQVYDLATDDFTAPLGKLREKEPPVVLLPAYYQTAATIMKQAKKYKLGTVFLGGDSWDTPELQKQGGAATKGHFFVAQFAADDPDPATAAFVTAFNAKFKRDPGVIAALGYDSVALAIDVMRRANSNLAASLVKALERTQGFRGASGVVAFSAQGDTTKSAVIKETTAAGAKFKARVGDTGVVSSGSAPSPTVKGH
jgi:branched-chain amino acid transport system substrate-binding protein